MTREGLTKALIDLGWIALTERALGLRPAEAHALRQLTRRPGVVITFAAMADEYAGEPRGRADRVTGTKNAIQLRVQRVAQALADVGCADAIEPVWKTGYRVSQASAVRIEAALLAACGVAVAENAA
jgi:DNA-binding response OmpR family regulator